MKSLLVCLFILIGHTSLAEENALFAFATIKTSMGDIKIKLLKKEAPRTVENFIGLATGNKHYRDTKTGKRIKDTPFYRDMIFHKVHPQLGIQSGCPWGNGKGWPGFTIKKETNDLKFDKEGRIAMAQIQGDSNSVGSQFFITTAPSEHLNGEYTIFGEVINGYNIVKQMSRSKRDSMMKPLKPIRLHNIEITGE